MKILKALSSQPNEFSVTFYCKNCRANNTYWFPEGTRVIRAPYLGNPNVESIAIIHRPGEYVEHIQLKCKVCKIGSVA